MNDYRINLFEIAYLTQEQVALFQSDFRIVADYFVQKREKGDYTPEPYDFKHIQETLQLLSAMSKDNRFEEAYKDDTKGGIHNMCDVLDRIELKGRREGRQEGRQEGRREGELKAKKEMALSLAGMGISVEKIAEAAKVSIEVVKQWITSDGNAAR